MQEVKWRQLDPAPTSNSRKGEMQAWLTAKGIPWEETMVKPDLYKLVKLYKPFHKTFALDRIAQEHGHVILRLPPYHPDLNPIEKIWALLKDDVAAKNVQFTMKEVHRQATEKLATITVEDWKKRCERAKRFEQFYREQDVIVDELQDRFIINLGEDSSEEDSDPDEPAEVGETVDYDDNDDNGIVTQMSRMKLWKGFIFFRMIVMQPENDLKVHTFVNISWCFLRVKVSYQIHIFLPIILLNSLNSFLI